MSSTEDYSLFIKFLDKSETFVLGFECGQVYQQLQNVGYFKGTVHSKNIEQLRLIAKK